MQRANGQNHDILSCLRGGHPRLFITIESWRAIQKRRLADPEYDRLAEFFIQQAEAATKQPPIERRMIGRRLLETSREAILRIWKHAAAWRLSADPKFLAAARREMLAAAGFSDWNPSHFLDVAEMTAALSVGYDWLYEALDADTRSVIRTAIVQHGLRPALEENAHTWFYASRHNWNQVCLGGLTLGALAIAEDEPELAREILARARRHIFNGLSAYAPDGVYPEGPRYWSYGTGYQVLLIEAVRTALGMDWDMPKAEGFLVSADFIIHATGPTGLLFSFADSRPEARLLPILLWFARERKSPHGAQDILGQWRATKGVNFIMGREWASVLALVWWPEIDQSEGPPPSGFWYGRGANPVAFWRSGWNDPNAVYFAIKGGGANVNHGHMDGGSFVMDAGGVRWAEDLGAQDYHSLEQQGVNLWDRTQTGQRWEVFRLNNHSHNTLTIEGSLHRADALAVFLRADESGAEIDLSPIFCERAERVTRTVHWRGLEGVELHDYLEGMRPGVDVRWALVTSAAASVEEGSIQLSKGGKRLAIVFEAGRVSPAVVSIEKPGGFNAENPGYRRVELHSAADATGRAEIRVKLKPQ